MNDGSTRILRLRDLGLLARLGVAGVVITAIGGTAVSGWYLSMHHNARDGRDGLTVNDVVAHYHGIVSPSPLVEALENGHPEEALPERQRELLLEWLKGDPAMLSQRFDDLDLGDDAPAEIIAVSCLDCHARTSTGPDAYPEVPLEYWDDVQALAISQDIQPVPTEILALSTHTHALGMSAIGGLIAVLGLMTSWPRRLIGLVVAATGVGLVGDIGGWWLTKAEPVFAYLVMVCGTMYSGGMSLLGVAILLDLCMPGRRGRDDGSSADVDAE
ncbi:MAG: hypothetical protein AAF297_06895 [Planctomycetota bacterium]